jgi:hypothetical protein
MEIEENLDIIKLGIPKYMVEIFLDDEQPQIGSTFRFQRFRRLANGTIRPGVALYRVKNVVQSLLGWKITLEPQGSVWD